MIVFGFFLSIFVGVLLGLLGGGGSILTVPLLHYIFQFSATVSVQLSLFIVGTVSLVGALISHAKGRVRFKSAAVFAVTSLLTVLLTRKWVLPLIPSEVKVGELSVLKDTLMITCFAIVMLLAGTAMLRKTKLKHTKIPESDSHGIPKIKIAMRGLQVGIVTGFVGSGGGFLIVPALSILLKMDMRDAVGTSLAIIAFNSLGGFFADVLQMYFKGTGDGSKLETGLTLSDIPWEILFTITGLALVGMLLGSKLSSKIPSHRLKPIFGYFVLISATLIIVKEIFLS